MKARPLGPKPHLLSGNSREFYKDQLRFLTESAREFGDVVRLRFFHVPVYLLNHPEHIELVFNSRNFVKPMSLRLPLQRRIFGNGLLSSQGDIWLRQRRMTQPAFHRDRLAGYGESAIAAAKRMTANWQDGEVRDVYPEMRALALVVAAKCLFNADMNSDGAIVRGVCNTIVQTFASQGGLPWVLDNFLPTPNNLRFRKAIGRLDRIIYDLISKRRERNEALDDLLSMLLAVRDQDGTQMSSRQLRDEIVTLFVASHEATALALSWTCYLLSQYPDIQDAVVKELLGVLDGRRTPNATDLPAFCYTGKVIKESMRLYPPNRSVGREALNDCEIGGYHVPAGTQVLMSQWVVQRDSRYFAGPDEFKPERWTAEFVDQLPKYAYFPFGGGPRVCIGQYLAMMETTLVIATVLLRFRLTLAEQQAVEPCPIVLLRPKNGIRIRLTRREL